MKLRRFWFEFEFEKSTDLPSGLALGCGVTARNFDEAMQLIGEQVFPGRSLPKLARRIDDVDVRALDQNHVIPNMRPPDMKGIWFPLGYG
jgi:hypothetical protein